MHSPHRWSSQRVLDSIALRLETISMDCTVALTGFRLPPQSSHISCGGSNRIKLRRAGQPQSWTSRPLACARRAGSEPSIMGLKWRAKPDQLDLIEFEPGLDIG